LPLSVVEVGRNGDHGLVDFVAKIRLRRFLQLAKNLGRDFLRRVFLVADSDLHVVLRTADNFVRHHLLFGLDLRVTAPP